METVTTSEECFSYSNTCKYISENFIVSTSWCWILFTQTKKKNCLHEVNQNLGLCLVGFTWVKSCRLKMLQRGMECRNRHCDKCELGLSTVLISSRAKQVSLHHQLISPAASLRRSWLLERREYIYFWLWGWCLVHSGTSWRLEGGWTCSERKKKSERKGQKFKSRCLHIFKNNFK